MKLPGLDPQTLLASAPKQSVDANDEKALRDAAQSFESLLVNEMLKSMRSAAGLGDKGFGESVFTSMLDETFAQNIAESGGFGLADSLAQQIGAIPPQGAQQTVDTAIEGLNVSRSLKKGGPS